MGAIRIQHLALGITLAVICAGCRAWKPPVVAKVARTINNAETIFSKDEADNDSANDSIS